MHFNIADEFIIGYVVFYLLLHIALWRKKLSKAVRRRALMGMLATVPASLNPWNSYHRHALAESVELSICAAAALVLLWDWTSMIKEGDVEKQKRLDAGIVLKEDREYHEWAKPDAE